MVLIVMSVFAGVATAGPVDSFKTFKAVFTQDGQLVVAGAVTGDPPYNADNTGKTDASAVKCPVVVCSSSRNAASQNRPPSTSVNRSPPK